MEQYSRPDTDILRDHAPQQLPSSLNTLTILTFVGCGFSYLGALWGLVANKNPEEQMEKLQEAREKMGDGFMAKWMDGSLQMIERSQHYKWINLVLGLLFTTLCLIGALQMRKLKKQGFGIYAIGELAPIPVMFVLMGVNIVTMVTGGFGALIAIIFTALYAGQRKYMVNN